MAVEYQDGMRAADFIFLDAQGNGEVSYGNEGRKVKMWLPPTVGDDGQKIQQRTLS